MIFLPGKRDEKHRLSDFNAVYYCIKIKMVCQPLFFKNKKYFSHPGGVRRRGDPRPYNIRKRNGRIMIPFFPSRAVRERPLVRGCVLYLYFFPLFG